MSHVRAHLCQSTTHEKWIFVLKPLPHLSTLAMQICEQDRDAIVPVYRRHVPTLCKILRSLLQVWRVWGVQAEGYLVNGHCVSSRRWGGLCAVVVSRGQRLGKLGKGCVPE